MEKTTKDQTDLYERPLNIIRITGLQKYANSAGLEPAELHSVVVNCLQEKYESHYLAQKGMNIMQQTANGNNAQTTNSLIANQFLISNNGRKVLFFVGDDFSTLKQAIDSADVTNVLVFSTGKFRKDTVAKHLGRTFNYIKMPLPEMELSNCPISAEDISPNAQITDGTTHFLLQEQVKNWAGLWNKVRQPLICFLKNALIDYIDSEIDRFLGPVKTIAELYIKCCLK